MEKFQSYHGVITTIDDFWTTSTGEGAGCYKLMSVEIRDGSIINFVVAPGTYFVNHVTLAVGDRVTGYYDANAPVPLIYPPQLRAIVMVRDTPFENVKVDFFNNDLVSSDGMLKLNLSPSTEIVLENNQTYTRYPGNQNLIVIYGPTTKSIPAQTTPFKVIVMC